MIFTPVYLSFPCPFPLGRSSSSSAQNVHFLAMQQWQCLPICPEDAQNVKAEAHHDKSNILHATLICAVSINGTSKDAKLGSRSTKSGLWWSLTVATAILASVSLKER